MWVDFKKFILKGNVVDLAVAVIIGSAFGKIVSSFVNDVLMPGLSVLIGTVNFKTLKWVLEEAKDETPELAVYYGLFIQNIVDFVIIAFVIFLMIRLIQRSKKKQVDTPAELSSPPENILLLTEIRDLLKTK